ncbi:sulfotransferase family 2 domain-containing protein [Ruegeria sp.]|uniref:sulfotransferase family 2 domain-containing protein n=1 Tax=Ruegeria sp. TaxID=1879320 RepID=UPI0023276744|nr:sulfotransferase family 2 domain-containing protein [Ruegeria sp.]MDA7963242.1 sulfotransferase family 2 domain-containing protein [Ruegeria sp.]
MLVFYEERLALLSVPKTGSSAYLSALRDRADLVVAGPPELKHASVRRYDRFFQHMFQKMFDTEMEIMAVVRDPVDWLGSWYRYRSRPELDGHPNSTSGESFEGFVQAYLNTPRPAFADVGSQTEFFQTRSNGAGATHVFKYEHQDKILDFLQNRLNCEIQLPQENVSPKRDLDLSDKTLAKYRRKHASEFALHEAAQ